MLNSGFDLINRILHIDPKVKWCDTGFIQFRIDGYGVQGWMTIQSTYGTLYIHVHTLLYFCYDV